MDEKLDIAIMGGGLSGALIAWRLKTERPDISFAVIESEQTIGGEHTWSFHDTDLLPNLKEWIMPLVSLNWEGQAVRFPRYNREIATSYCSITSDRLRDVVQPVIQENLIAGNPVAWVEGRKIVLVNGDSVIAESILDARGGMPPGAMSFGFQKFVGQFLEMKEPHGVKFPIIMDATVDQVDGYRFVYVLPFSETQLLIEDTRYADGSELAEDGFRKEIARYCKEHGWHPVSTIREEQGVLPIALAGDIDAAMASFAENVAPVGMKAGLFHPLTGYSLPDAVKTAELVARCAGGSEDLVQTLKLHAKKRWQSGSYYRLLSRMLYGAAKHNQRYKVLERFYRLPEELIERFYAGVSTKSDKARVLAGKPPVPVLKALQCMSETDWLRRSTPSVER